MVGCRLSKISLGQLAFKFLWSIVTGVALTILNPLWWGKKMTWESLRMIGISISRTNGNEHVGKKVKGKNTNTSEHRIESINLTSSTPGSMRCFSPALSRPAQAPSSHEPVIRRRRFRAGGCWQPLINICRTEDHHQPVLLPPASYRCV